MEFQGTQQSVKKPSSLRSKWPLGARSSRPADPHPSLTFIPPYPFNYLIQENAKFPPLTKGQVPLRALVVFITGIGKINQAAPFFFSRPGSAAKPTKRALLPFWPPPPLILLIYQCCPIPGHTYVSPLRSWIVNSKNSSHLRLEPRSSPFIILRSYSVCYQLCRWECTKGHTSSRGSE